MSGGRGCASSNRRAARAVPRLPVRLVLLERQAHAHRRRNGEQALGQGVAFTARSPIPRRPVQQDASPP